ncbi:MAG: hypothetical protein M1541_12915 [Acidobacteria bacterium]|nr:hypothetical protein [Acidobacteriota bacterium]
MIQPLDSNTFFFAPRASGTQTAASAGNASKAASAADAQPQQATSQTDSLPAPPPGSEYTPENFEKHMNAWYLSRVAFENETKTSIYNQAMDNWKVNNEQRQALGLPLTPKPEPPVLAKAEPMPPGYWYYGSLRGEEA